MEKKYYDFQNPYCKKCKKKMSYPFTYEQDKYVEVGYCSKECLLKSDEFSAVCEALRYVRSELDSFINPLLTFIFLYMQKDVFRINLFEYEKTHMRNLKDERKKVTRHGIPVNHPYEVLEDWEY